MSNNIIKGLLLQGWGREEQGILNTTSPEDVSNRAFNLAIVLIFISHHFLQTTKININLSINQNSKKCGWPLLCLNRKILLMSIIAGFDEDPYASPVLYLMNNKAFITDNIFLFMS